MKLVFNTISYNFDSQEWLIDKGKVLVNFNHVESVEDIEGGKYCVVAFTSGIRHHLAVPFDDMCSMMK